MTTQWVRVSCFSKAKILKVRLVQDWNQELYKFKVFSRQISLQSYNYYDYIDAWYNTLPSAFSTFVVLLVQKENFI